MNTTKTTMMTVLLASAIATAVVAPAAANWFSDARSGTMLNVGSAPSPTPEQLRAIGDSNYRQQGYRGRVELTPDYDLRLEGRTVFGARGERLGYVIAVDTMGHLVELQTPNGIGVAVPSSLIVDNGRRVSAPTISRADMRAMARAQTGRTVALNIDLRPSFPRS